MDSISKSYAFILIGILAISCMGLLTVESVSAQTIHRPSVPEFTAMLTASSLEVTIKNQQITGFDDYLSFKIEVVVPYWALPTTTTKH